MIRFEPAGFWRGSRHRFPFCFAKKQSPVRGSYCSKKNASLVRRNRESGYRTSGTQDFMA